MMEKDNVERKNEQEKCGSMLSFKFGISSVLSADVS